MKSKAHISSHPIHPMLIPFPLAFLTGGFLFYVLSIIFNNPSFEDTSRYLRIAGLMSAVITAIPGVIDLAGTVPSNSSAKKRGVVHGLINLSATLLFLISLYFNNEQTTTLIFQAGGVVLLTVGGWLGATLVYRNQIGVDHRYANSGKWNEESFDTKSSRIIVAQENELKEGQMKLVKINGKRIVITRSENGYAAFDDHCTHRGGSLAGGVTMCGTVQCPWHGSQFNVSTGEVKAGPAKNKIKNYGIEKSGDDIILLFDRAKMTTSGQQK